MPFYIVQDSLRTTCLLSDREFDQYNNLRFIGVEHITRTKPIKTAWRNDPVNTSLQRRGCGDSPISVHSPHSCQTIVTQFFNPHLDRQMPMAGKYMIRVDIVRFIAEIPTIIRSDEMLGTNFRRLLNYTSNLLAQVPTSRFKSLQ